MYCLPHLTHLFDLDEVERMMWSVAERATPFVIKLPQSPGSQGKFVFQRESEKLDHRIIECQSQENDPTNKGVDQPPAIRQIRVSGTHSRRSYNPLFIRHLEVTNQSHWLH